MKGQNHGKDCEESRPGPRDSSRSDTGGHLENDTQNGTRHNVTVTRLYKDGDEWKDSVSFGRDDLPLVGKVLDRCHSWIFEQAAAASNGNGHERNGEDASF